MKKVGSCQSRRDIRNERLTLGPEGAVTYFYVMIRFEMWISRVEVSVAAAVGMCQKSANLDCGEIIALAIRSSVLVSWLSSFVCRKTLEIGSLQ